MGIKKRPDILKVEFCLDHRYITLAPETERQMDFYSHIRTDGLARRIEKPFEMTETFEDRTDFLFYRHVVYGKQIKVIRAGEALEQRPLQVMLSHQTASTFKQFNPILSYRYNINQQYTSGLANKKHPKDGENGSMKFCLGSPTEGGGAVSQRSF